jgi:hypothetical protein
MTTVSSVLSTVKPRTVIYDLNELFDAAVADQKMRAADLERYSNSEFGNSMYSALLNNATNVVSALQAFKDAGVTEVETKHALPENERLSQNPDALLYLQIARGQVKPVVAAPLKQAM